MLWIGLLDYDVEHGPMGQFVYPISGPNSDFEKLKKEPSVVFVRQHLPTHSCWELFDSFEAHLNEYDAALSDVQNQAIEKAKAASGLPYDSISRPEICSFPGGYDGFSLAYWQTPLLWAIRSLLGQPGHKPVAEGPFQDFL